jgi:hypothetical protein
VSIRFALAVRADPLTEPAEAFRHRRVTKTSRPHAPEFPKTPEYWNTRQPKTAEIAGNPAIRPRQYQRLLD